MWSFIFPVGIFRFLKERRHFLCVAIQNICRRTLQKSSCKSEYNEAHSLLAHHVFPLEILMRGKWSWGFFPLYLHKYFPFFNFQPNEFRFADSAQLMGAGLKKCDPCKKNIFLHFFQKIFQRSFAKVQIIPMKMFTMHHITLKWRSRLLLSSNPCAPSSQHQYIYGWSAEKPIRESVKKKSVFGWPPSSEALLHLCLQEMTIPWCLKRAELVFKCVKGPWLCLWRLHCVLIIVAPERELRQLGWCPYFMMVPFSSLSELKEPRSILDRTPKLVQLP